MSVRSPDINVVMMGVPIFWSCIIYGSVISVTKLGSIKQIHTKSLAFDYER